MTDTQNNTNSTNSAAESDIDLMSLLVRLWHARLFLLKCCAAGAVLGLIVGFSIPKRYRATAVIAPETEQKMGSGVSSLASMMGMNLDNNVDAINVNMFPEVVHSTPFIFGLFDLPVETADGELRTTLLDYMLNHQKKAWWSYVIEAPFAALEWGISLVSGKEEEPEGALQMHNLPKKERAVIKYFSNALAVSIDKKTGKTDMSLEMQDPLVVATVMNAVLDHLKAYMSDYRTSKSRQDAENLSVICEERKADYYRTQQQYAAYADANKSVVLQSVQAERERLQQEMQLAYQVYSQVATQLEAARIKEQQAKPVFAIIDPVTVPLRKSAPSKAKLLVGFVFLFGCAGVAWELFGRDALKRLHSSL
ncbi:MAG: chain-length determining protein [Alistipes sp.]|nr:chain-length determining protein [Alistipes sp.]